ncbi:expressed unknown protein [Seminavis robusta]|uniref:Uncharacterized protein n=1 Tax=Seminavis robusta TaxID=568900 RepID=A0A9N8EQ05_9STRA|nr:expressed unknown protein [Seminavis robusta]|eukprot:Sro1375_g267370.1 n/a (174) ;mRNA; r:16873-17394
MCYFCLKQALERTIPLALEEQEKRAIETRALNAWFDGTTQATVVWEDYDTDPLKGLIAAFLDDTEVSRVSKDNYVDLVACLHTLAKDCNRRSPGNGHADPLAFSCAVVAEQMLSQLKDANFVLTPHLMMSNLKQVIRRMQTVDDPDPYGCAVQMGVKDCHSMVRIMAEKLEQS